MKASFAIFALLFVAFHVGADALKCYKDAPHREEMTCKEEGQKCYRIRDGNAPPHARGCVDEEVEERCKDDPSCSTCDTDLCNALQCYSSTEKKPVGCDKSVDMCITDRSTDERNCGRCEGAQGKCEQCTEDMCNKPLFCLDSANEEEQCKEDGSDPPKCVTILDEGRAVEKKCGTCSPEEIKQKGCEECDSDKCNDKPVQPLNCYDVTNQLTKCKDVRDKCITVMHKDDPARAVDKMCGTCSKWKMDATNQQMLSGGCLECNTDKCNEKHEIKLLSCFNATGKQNKCADTRDNCVTIKDKGRVVDKGCGTCSREDKEQNRCADCDSDGCNEKPDIQPLKCQDNTNHAVKCTDARHYCYTKKRNVKNWDGHDHDNDLVEEKGCGKCNGSSTTATHDGEVFIEGVINCTHCYRNECNSEKLEDKLDCFDEKNKDGSVKTCHAGEKCVVAYTKVGDKWALHQHCGLCPTNRNPPKLGFCKQCNSSKCNVYEYPKCKAGAGNGAGDFFVDKKCTEKLYLNKDMNITATCIKQQVEGITYKDCGSCGAFVDYTVTKIPNLPKNANINKCHECVSTEGDEKPCNGGILAHHLPVPFWLFLVIGACIPWLMLYRAVPFTNV